MNLRVLIILLGVVLSGHLVKAQTPVSLPAIPPYVEDFNTTPGASGTSYPTGWISNNRLTANDAAMSLGNASSTTGANYNYGSQIGLLGSGSNFDPATLILAIDNTAGLTGLRISYKVTKIREGVTGGSRSCSFNLQISTNGASYTNVSGGGYSSGNVPAVPQGQVTYYTDLDISALDNYSGTVFIRWYYATDGGAGSRDGIALDDVVITWDSKSKVESPVVSNITDTSARLGATVASIAGGTALQRGIIWDTVPQLKLGLTSTNKVMVSGTSTGLFDTTLNNLPRGQRIYFRGYVISPTDTAYSDSVVFYTLAREPLTHSSSFTATAVSKTGIFLKWTSVAGASGYLITSRITTPPLGIPEDSVSYTTGTYLNDAKVVGVLYSDTATALQVNGLINGTRYYFGLIPFNHNSRFPQTINYKTDSFPVATDSTLGVPPSRLSIIQLVSGSESSSISSVKNLTTITDSLDGTRVLRLRLMDGGSSLSDPDELPTVLKKLKLRRGPQHENGTFTTCIAAAALYSDSTGAKLADGVIYNDSIVFNNVGLTALDNHFNTARIYITLLPKLYTDKSLVQFSIDSLPVTEGPEWSSYFGPFSSPITDTLRNRVEVVATQLVFKTQPSTSTEANARMANAVRVAFTDKFGGIDTDRNDTITLLAIGDTLSALSVSRKAAIDGEVTFDSLYLVYAATGVRFKAGANGFTDTLSNAFNIVNSVRTDVITVGNEASNISYDQYTSYDPVDFSNSLRLWSFAVRDGGLNGDNDTASSYVSAITISKGTGNTPTWASSLRRAALFRAGVKLAEVNVTAETMSFTGISSLTVTDDDTAVVDLYVTFDTINVVDNQQFRFAITTAGLTLNAGGSGRAATFVTAQSELAGDTNRLEVSADRMRIIQQPVNVASGTVMSPAVSLYPIDRYGFRDLDLTATVAVIVLDSLVTLDPLATDSVNFSAGTASFSNLRFMSMSPAVKLRFVAAGLQDTVSNNFAVTASVASDIIATGGATVDIPYINYTGDTIITTSDGVKVYSVLLRDGGAIAPDNDTVPTLLNNLIFDKGTGNQVGSWASVIRKAALFNGPDKIAETRVTGENIAFTNLGLVVPDNGSYPLELYITFDTTAITDNQQFRFRIARANATLLGGGSQWTNFTDALSSIGGDSNRIEVQATDIRFVQEPLNVNAGRVQTPAASVEAIDANRFRDLDFMDTISLTVSPVAFDSRSVIVSSANNGVAAFNNLIYDGTAAQVSLIADAVTLDTTLSKPFAVLNANFSDLVAAGDEYVNIVPVQDTIDQIISNTDGVHVWSVLLRDGGNTADNDTLPTLLKRIVIQPGTYNNVNWNGALKRVALFANGVLLKEKAYTSGNIDFDSLTATAPDNGTLKLELHLSFKPGFWLDRSKLQFEVQPSLTVFDPAGSLKDAFPAFSSRIGADSNSIQVIATRLAFDQQPSDVSVGAAIDPAVGVKALDDFGNTDLDSRAITLQVYGSAYATNADSTGYVSAATQNAVFDRLTFAIPADPVYLEASAPGLASATSDSFVVSAPLWFRTVSSGSWEDINVWESSADSGSTWSPAIYIPAATRHGRIAIRTGHQVTMSGNKPYYILDETSIDSGAVLYTPAALGTALEVTEGPGTDLLISGKLVHTNYSVASPVLNGQVLVKSGGAIELATAGSALNWAANNAIVYEDGARYIHSTSNSISIPAGTYFGSSDPNAVPVFVVNATNNFPAVIAPDSVSLIINGLLEVTANRSFSLRGSGNKVFRNGVRVNGTLQASNQGNVLITGVATLSGSGTINLEDQVNLEITPVSATLLTSDVNVNTTGTAQFNIAGALDMQAFELTGTAAWTIKQNAYLAVSGAAGLDAIQFSGSRYVDSIASYEFYGNTAQSSGYFHSGAAANMWNNNSNSLQLSSPLYITDTLYLNTSSLSTSGAALLTLRSTANISGFSSTRFIQGPLAWEVADTMGRTFPIGKNNHYGPVTVLNADVNADVIKAEYFDEPVPAALDTTQLLGYLSRVNGNEYWNLQTAQAGRVVLWPTSLSSITAAATDLRVAAWNGAGWESQGPDLRTATLSRIESDPINLLNGYFTIAEDSACVTPATPVFSPDTICAGNSVVLAASGTGEVIWFANNTDEQPLASGNTFALSALSNDTVLYVAVRQRACISSRLPYTVTVNALPAAPVLSGLTVCYGEQPVIQPAAGTYNWYADAQRLNLISSGTSFAFSQGLTRDTIVYVSALSNGCESSVVPVTVKVRSQLIAPVASAVTVCEGTSALLSVANPGKYNWYADTTAAPLATGNFLRTNILMNDTVFYVAAVDGTCIGPKTTVSVTVTPSAIAPLAQSITTCSGTAPVFQVSGSGTYNWYSSDTATVPLFTGNSFNPGALSNNTTFYVENAAGTCPSARVPMEVKILRKPEFISITAPLSTPENANVTIAATPFEADSYTWDFGTDAIPATATGPGPHQVRWSSIGLKQVRLTAANTSGSVTCDNVLQHTVEVQIPAGRAATVSEHLFFDVYPNPAQGMIQLRKQGLSNEDAVLQITDISGKLIWSGQMDSGAETLSLDLSTLPEGMYFLHLSTGAYQQHIKFMLRY